MRLPVQTPIQHLTSDNFNNNVFIKREDLIPYSFGGNKARKAFLFFEEIDSGDYDYVVTYGSSKSNHCRVISNMAAERCLGCHIISPDKGLEITNNSRMLQIFNSDITYVPVEQVSETIGLFLKRLSQDGHKPYFIPGGGHSILGTQAYVNCYDEICAFEKKENTYFDYIFIASGTGTTQAGLICGQIIQKQKRAIVGVSIARKSPYGATIVSDSVKEYLQSHNISAEFKDNVLFADKYTCNGYGEYNKEIISIIKEALINYGIHFDTTYTGKAYWGMREYIAENDIKGKNILFIHTGGTPLFFDDLRKII